jgi:ribosome-associated protein
LATATSRAADRPQRSQELALAAAQIAHDNRGQDIVVLDLRELTSEFDFFVIVTGTSRRQMHAVSEEIDRIFAEQYGEKRLGLEGYTTGSWILQDYGDIVIHLFDRDARDYYAMEDLWAGCRRVEWQPETEPKIASA